MPELATFQRDFVALLDRPGRPAEPLQVYRNTVLLGAVEALADNYPVVRRVVGEREFERLAVAHARLHPPLSPVLADYGILFADWLAAHELARELPYLADIARCERLWIETLCAADAPVLKLEELERLDRAVLPGLRLDFHPATRFAWLATPAMPIWLAHQDQPMGEIAPEWRPCGALFTRPDFGVEAAELDAAAYRMLAGLRLGETLGRAAEAALQFHRFADVGAIFAQLVGRGAFTTYSH